MVILLTEHYNSNNVKEHEDVIYAQRRFNIKVSTLDFAWDLRYPKRGANLSLSCILLKSYLRTIGTAILKESICYVHNPGNLEFKGRKSAIALMISLQQCPTITFVPTDQPCRSALSATYLQGIISTMSSSSPVKVWYDANCHCRLVRLRLRIPPLFSTPSSPSVEEPLKVINCNCSICTKNGYLNIYPEDPDTNIEWLSGKDELKRYEFGIQNCGHMFCPNCGSSVALFIKDVEKIGGGPNLGINVSDHFLLFQRLVFGVR